MNMKYYMPLIDWNRVHSYVTHKCKVKTEVQNCNTGAIYK